MIGLRSYRTFVAQSIVANAAKAIGSPRNSGMFFMSAAGGIVTIGTTGFTHRLSYGST